MTTTLENLAERPPIPSKRYFSLAEVSTLTGITPDALAHWGHVLLPLAPHAKKSGTRQHYLHQEVLALRRMKAALPLDGVAIALPVTPPPTVPPPPVPVITPAKPRTPLPTLRATGVNLSPADVRSELLAILAWLGG